MCDLLQPKCGSCSTGHTPFCPLCEKKLSLDIDHLIAMSVAAMAEISDDKERHEVWDRVRVMLAQRAQHHEATYSNGAPYGGV